MSETKSNIIIGSFVVGAVLLLFLLLLFFSTGNYFTEKERVLMYFDGSVQGLQIGAPVKLKGVDLGEVVEIEVILEADNLTLVNRVAADIVLNRIQQRGNEVVDNNLELLIQRGLSAQLNYQSFLTGLLYVELDFDSDSELNLLNFQPDYLEIPTRKTDFEFLFQEIQKVDIGAISRNLQSILESVDEILESGAIENLIDDVSTTALAIERTAGNIDEAANTLQDEISQLRTSFNTTLGALDVVLNQTSESLPVLSDELVLTLTELRNVLDSAATTMNTAENTLSEDSLFMVEMTRAAQDVSRAAQAFRQLSEALEQEPESLLRGRRGE